MSYSDQYQCKTYIIVDILIFFLNPHQCIMPKNLENALVQVLTQLRYCEVCVVQISFLKVHLKKCETERSYSISHIQKRFIDLCLTKSEYF